MDLSNPFGTMVPRKMTAGELARAIAQDIAAELDAAALYQAHIDATDDERAKAILAHIRDEEKEHTAEFLGLLKMLDPVQAGFLEEGDSDVAGILRQAGLTSKTGNGEEESRPESEQATAPEPGSMTVGSLLENSNGGGA